MTEKLDYYERPEMSNSKLTWYIHGGGQGKGISEKAADRGHLFHTAIFEPHIYQETLDRVRDRVTAKEIAETKAMSEKAKTCHSLQVFLSHPKVEFETERYGELYGVPFKMKADAMVPNCIGDGKSTAAKTLDDFLKSCKKFGYWRQAVIYTRLSGIKKMVFWGVSKSFPHNIFYVDISKYPEEIAEAELEVEKYCLRWKSEQEPTDFLLEFTNAE